MDIVFFLDLFLKKWSYGFVLFIFLSVYKLRAQIRYLFNILEAAITHSMSAISVALWVALLVASSTAFYKTSPLFDLPPPSPLTPPPPPTTPPTIPSATTSTTPPIDTASLCRHLRSTNHPLARTTECDRYLLNDIVYLSANPHNEPPSFGDQLASWVKTYWSPRHTQTVAD